MTNKKKLKEFVTTKPVLKEMLKDLLEEKKKGNIVIKNKMAISMYLSVIKRHRVAGWIRKQDP